MNNLKTEKNINNLNYKDDYYSNNEIIEGLKTEDNITEETQNYSLKEELIRIKDFYKEQPSIIVIVIFITYLIYYSFKDNDKIKSKTGKYIKFVGGSGDSNEMNSQEYKSMKASIFELLINTQLWNRLKQHYSYDEGIMNKIIVIFGFVFLGFIVRPIKSFFFVVAILIGISGSFLFPFLIFGIMLYYVFKKILVNKKPNFD
jgi:hypothetical protein